MITLISLIHSLILFDMIQEFNTRKSRNRPRYRDVGEKRRNVMLKSLNPLESHPSKYSVEDATSPRAYLASRQNPPSVTMNGIPIIQIDCDRTFVSTNSSLFYEHKRHDLSTSTMKQIPISPMFEAKPGMVWSKEFFGRGGTSYPSKRNEWSSLPGLEKTSCKPDSQPLFTRDINPSPRTPLTVSPISLPSTSSADESPRVDITPSRTQPGRRSRSATNTLPTPVQITTTAYRATEKSHLTGNEPEIEPWVSSMISKYDTDLSCRPHSRCTARLQQSSSMMDFTGPPMGLGAMEKSRSYSYMLGLSDVC